MFSLVEYKQEVTPVGKEGLNDLLIATGHREFILAGTHSCQEESRSSTQVTGTETYSATQLFPLTNIGGSWPFGKWLYQYSVPKDSILNSA